MSTLKVEDWAVEKLIPYVRNPRKNDEQVDRMCGAIKEFGFRIPVVAKSDGTVVDGHLRLKAALKLGMKTVPVALADELTDAQVKAFRILANQSANWAEWDMELLADEMKELIALGKDVELTGFSLPEAEDIIDSMNVSLIADEPASISGEGFGLGSARVKVTMDGECVGALEKAIAKTGLKNRMEAVKTICEAYLEKR